MKIAERILYASAGAHCAAAFTGLAVDWRTFYYGSLMTGSLSALVLFVSWFRQRRTASEGN
ncbi:hypothetical protein [Novosphingobium sp. AP12]|uniref:hypothetical protein n=1 Tax=Novosphingobium sp. AP12 TaxID=1144305 RepID=UPI0012F9002C|nr:hypothetical protein [Novosphingobium sp. AP12]